MRRFISFSPHLYNEIGHHLIYQKALEKVANQLHIRFLAILSKRCLLQNFSRNWQKHFSHSKIRIFDWFKRIRDYFVIFHKYKKKSVFYFLECFGTFDFSAIFFSLIFSLRQDQQIGFVYRYDLRKTVGKGKPIIWMTKLLKMKYGDQVVLFSDSHLLVEELSKQVNFVYQLLPIPHACTCISNKKEKDKNIICWWPGDPRFAKGIPEIQSFFSQLKKGFSLALSQKTPLPNSSFIISLPESLTQKQYQKWMQISDLILLPYHPSEYRVNTSGIFFEAITAGKIPVVKKGTWLANECKRFGLNELIIDWESLNLCQQFKEIVKNEEINQKLDVMRNSYLQFHTQKNFTHILSKCLDR